MGVRGVLLGVGGSVLGGQTGVCESLGLPSPSRQRVEFPASPTWRLGMPAGITLVNTM